MNDLTRDSERLLSDSRQLLIDNRVGGRHRRVAPIGRESAAVRNRHRLKKLRNIAIAAVAIFAIAILTGLVIDGIGFLGIVLTFFALIAAAGIFSVYPRISIPQAGDLNKGTPRQMVARTELWLEQQRPALPAPAVQLVDDLGVKLDILGQQLETAPAGHDAIRDIRELVGETLPEMVQSYTRVPAAMRHQEHVGATADERLIEGLSKISGEIDAINRKIADGALDDLAVQTRYLGYRYGDGAASGADGAAQG
ncbi:hypothetical protein [Alteriqipengyuania lutimaris]|uniref:Uncharacterized protein n=1 Tax=Alteriqipengyuania lutimaris TaxID=1538146 RepID=A0A395LJW6_9SPHN|nr:hypothetical protein [Alteriqipengyuania lutimaris]MBB3033956.1 hypothetical protein [Alteriqipengyuania lutimaris]RDS77091.1 hypothetical protein DL238_05325 [Alteriqipengyuania lutimaris]